jgi:hypothetical protein
MKTETVRQLRLRVLALITVAGTAWISFSSSQDLAVRAGFGVRAWAFPVCLDAVAAFAVDTWMRRSSAQRAAGSLALTAIGLSLASNVADHFLITGTALAALLGGIPPIMLAWLLLVLHKHGAPAKGQTHPVFVPPGVIHAPGPDPASQFHRDELANHRAEDAHTPLLPPPSPVKAAPPEVIPLLDRRWTPQVNPQPAPEPVKPLPVNVPDNDPERTQIMPRIPAKAQPGDDVPSPAKVLPATNRAEVTASVESLAHHSDEKLVILAREGGHLTRRAVSSAFGIGTSRATKIAKLAKEG